MSPTVYSFLHVSSVLLLVAFVFHALAAPRPENRKPILAITGILSLVAVVAGFGVLAKLYTGFPGWIWIKVVAWLGISLLAGFAFRRPAAARTLGLAAIVLVLAALWAVYFKPF